VAADLYKEYLLSWPDIEEVTGQEVSLIVDKENDVLVTTPDRIATLVYASSGIEQDRSLETAIKDHQKENSFLFMEINCWPVRTTSEEHNI